MPFTEKIKKEARILADGKCGWCERGGFLLEVHHIIPQKDGGLDTPENAIALCPSCHAMLDGNPLLRKQLGERREALERRRKRDQSLIELTDEVRELKEKVASFEGWPPQAAASLESYGYSFRSGKLVHPLIILELLGWLSDMYYPICAVDLSVANESNRFHGDFTVKDVNERRWVIFEPLDKQQESISYAHIATSPSGTELVECLRYGGGGTGVFGDVAFFRATHDRMLEEKESSLGTRDRITLTIIGAIALGDRYFGSIQYDDGVLEIGEDRGPFREPGETARRIKVP